MPTIGMISLGCAKNQVNAEQMMYLLQQAGFTVTAEPDGADAVVINTCGFIDSAKSEAISNILEMAALKQSGRVGKIIVTGCLSERYREQIRLEMPEVDAVLGCGSYFEIVPAVQQALSGETPEVFGDIDAPIAEVDRVLSTPGYYAYLKIAEGCDNRCSYCVIPSLRGRYRSRSMENLLDEAARLARDGVQELIVVAQDTSRYGIDRYGEKKLPELLRKLCRIEGFRWIRIHYLYPDEITDELIDVIASEEKIVKYLDIPIQHCNDEILKKMNRRGNKAFLDALFLKLRARMEGLVLRTSLIAGLPGEGEAEFEELCAFLRKHKLERAGAFAFCPEEGTPAAQMDYPDSDVANRRAEVLTELQSRIMDAYNDSCVGKTRLVLCEGYDPTVSAYYGRSYAESPDIDGRIVFSAKSAMPGTFYSVNIVSAVDGELVGCVVEEQQV
ncbi:MAG: 30S ribosomal protein S12 methylthiotransferase RimO [Oscillospiraceae bacterium]|nr:30S ribosomal protein S12 methylthiotransferase RimO [Oscillospiraceae bacterium]